jgi:hypothetical protein
VSDSTVTDEPVYRNLDLVRRVVEPGADAERFWSADELGQILAHQLFAPLAVDLQIVGRIDAARAAELGASATPPIGTFRDALLHPEPHIGILATIKQFAEVELHSPEKSLPHDVALLLYDAAIVAARLRCGARITSLPDTKLIESLTHLLAEAWLEPGVRTLLRDGLIAVRQGLSAFNLAQTPFPPSDGTRRG